MVDRLNKINVNVGSVNNDPNQRGKQAKEEKETQVSEKPFVKPNHVDPDRVLDAMKKHGIHNLNHVIASGNVGCKSIEDAVNYFTNTITPEMHTQLTEKVKATCQKEFPSMNIHPDVIAEVVDNLLFDALI